MTNGSVTHVVIFTWIAEASDVQIKAFGAALTGLAKRLSDMVTMHHGPDLRFRDGNGDYALIATFRDRAGWDAYQMHPEHKAFVRDFVVPLQATRITIQF
ncbi:Dabb family protein [Sphingomonas sp.]|uniref:Dabb family protein n=1 Tax=Sphingomonas sp. TaxID=28214 RepID=UPI0025E29714|nr:Dabb family protein [Sphingomonas sp.]